MKIAPFRRALDVACLDLQASVWFCQIDPADHAIAPQQRHRVVAELTLGFGCVGLEAIGPAPEMFEAPTVPDDRVERSEEAYLPACLTRFHRHVRGPQIGLTI